MNKFGLQPADKHFATSTRTRMRVMSESGAPSLRIVCGAQRRRDGQPCEALSVPGKRRCKWHGGCSTGPRTDAGKARALANLRQYHDPDGRQPGGHSVAPENNTEQDGSGEGRRAQ